MPYTKIVGWIIFLIGLSAIIWTIFYSYNIYTAKAPAPEIFKMETLEKASVKTGKTGGILDIESQLQSVMQEQLKGFLPTDAITKVLNLAVFSILAFILIFAGTQIATLGIKLIK